VAAGIVLVVALLHFFPARSYLNGALFSLYTSYFFDVAVPFALYFLLCVEGPGLGWARHRRVRGLAVFAAASAVEVAQGLGLPILGRTFDPLDFVMFGVGVLLAMLVDKMLFERFVSFWRGSGRMPRESPP
jgi:hypothetical protein